MPCGIGLGGCATGWVAGGAGWVAGGAGCVADLCLWCFFACLCGFVAGLVDRAACGVAGAAVELEGTAAACGCRAGAGAGPAVEQPATSTPRKAMAASDRVIVDDMQRFLSVGEVQAGATALWAWP